MRGRTGVLIAILSSVVALGGLAVWLVLAPEAGRKGASGPDFTGLLGPHTDPDDAEADSAARKAAQLRRAELEAARLDAEEVRRARESGREDEAAREQDMLAAAEIDPEEVDAPVPGHLLVRVLDKVEDRALPGASVFFPVFGTSLASEGGDVKVGPEIAGLRKRANRHGAVIWSHKELARARDAIKRDAPELPSSVLVTHTGYADLFEPLAIPDLARGAEVTLRLHSSVRVTGRVREKKGGMVKHAAIEIVQISRPGEAATANRFKLTSDGLGEFALKVADAYLYRFEARTPGYAPYVSREFDFRRDERQVSIILEPARGVSGIVTGAGGAPIEGARVDSRNEALFTVTDAEGRFTFDMIRDGVWSNDVVLRFSAEGYAAQTRRVLANDHEIKVQLETEGRVSARAVTEKGESVAGALVSCVFVEGRARFPLEALLTDEDGRVSFGGLGEGTAQLSAKFENLASDIVPVAIKPGAHVQDVQIVLRTGAVITGRVTSRGLPIAGATITLAGAPAAASDEGGVYSLGGLQAGEHAVRVANQFPIDDAQLRQLPVFTTDGKTFYYLPAERKVRVRLAATETVDFDCQPFEADIDRKITVRVLTRPSEPVTGVQASVKPVLGQPPAGVEAPKVLGFALDLPDGKAEVPLSLLHGVSYELTLNHNRFFPATLDAETLAGVPGGGAIDLVLERAFIIKGYVKDSQGNGLEGVGLSRERNNPWAHTATTNIHGYFEFGQLREGDYLVTAFKQGYYQEKAEVKLDNADPAPLQLVLVSANEIRIVVRNGGSPQPGAQLDIYRNDAEGNNPDDFKRHFNIGTTDALGVKYINFHWVRNYQIVARYSGQVGFANFDNLREVPEREFVVNLEPAFELRGSVIDADTLAPLTNVVVRAHDASGVEGRAGNFFQVNTDGSGNFAFQVPAGSFWFYVPRTASHSALSTQGSNVGAGTTGHVLAVQLRDDIQGNYAQVLSFNAPVQMVAGQQYNVEVTMRNVGNTTWTSAGNQPWRLGSQAPRDNRKWGMARVPLPDGTQVNPKSSVSFQFTVTAPAQAGNHDMQWQMVQDGREWFGQMTQRLRIEVTAATGG